MAGTPAKKATPSLADLTNRNDEEVSAVEETPTVEETPVVEDGNKDVVDSSDNSDSNNNDDEGPVLSENVVATVPNKTPAELSMETPAETAARYGIDNKITDEDAGNPRVQVYKDTRTQQVPAGTHLHPDVAKDNLNRGISENTTDSAQVRRTVTEEYDFAPDAPHNDKFVDTRKTESHDDTIRKNDDVDS